MTGTPSVTARWGATIYGLRYSTAPGARWGSSYIAGARGSVGTAKSHTQFVSTSGAIQTDASQYAQDMTLDAGAVREPASTRAALTGATGYVFEWTGTLDSTAPGYTLHYRGDGGVNDYLRITVAPLGSVMLLGVQHGGTSKFPVIFDPIVGTKTAQVYVAARPNPLTTGAADALVIDAAVVVDGVWYHGQETHALASATVDTYVGGGEWNGASVINQPPSTTAVRISSRFHTATEFGEDFISSRAAGGTNFELRRQPAAVRKADGIGQDGHWFGQANVGAAAAAAQSVQRRLFGPLWSEVFRVAEDRLAKPIDQWVAENALGDGLALYADLVRWVPVSPAATHLRVYIHANNWAEVSAAPDPAAARDVTVKVYSLASLPIPALSDPTQLGSGLAVPTNASATLELPSTDNRPPATVDGAWYEVGSMPIARVESAKQAYSGTTFLAVGIVETSGTGEGRLRLNAINVVPFVQPGFGSDEP